MFIHIFTSGEVLVRYIAIRETIPISLPCALPVHQEASKGLPNNVRLIGLLESTTLWCKRLLLPAQKSAGRLKLLIISGYDKGWKRNVAGDTRGQSRANSMGSGIEITLSDAFSYDAALGRQVHAYEIERMVERARPCQQACDAMYRSRRTVWME